MPVIIFLEIESIQFHHLWKININMQRFEFNGSVITTRISSDVLYFRANDVVTALGYKSCSKQKPILSFVSEEYVTTFSDICSDGSDKPQTNYIQKNGVLQLVLRCKLPTARPFEKMLFAYLDKIVDAAVENIDKQKDIDLLGYQTKLALTEKSHAEIIEQFKQQISEYKEEVKELNDAIDDKDKELEEKEEEFEEEKEETFNNYEEELAEARKEIASLKRLLENVSSKKLTKKHVDKLHARDRDELKETNEQLRRELNKLQSGEQVIELRKTNMNYIQGLQRLRKDKERCIEIVRDAFDVEDALRRIKQERLDK